MKKSILLMAVLIALVSLCLVFASCDSGSSSGDDPTKPGATYTVTYDGNGATGGKVPVDSTKYKSGAEVTVLGNTGSLIKTNCNFGGWNTAADGKGTNYAAGAKFNITADTTLYAQWTPVTYTISFDANGGSGTMSDVPVEAGTSYEITECKFTAPAFTAKEGAVPATHKNFAGWNTKTDGTGTPYKAGDTINDITENITLYAQWADPSFSVSDTKKVYFAKGNLYWDGDSFEFETNQYDVRNNWSTSHVSHFYWSKTASVAYAETYSESGTTTDVFFTNAEGFTVNGVTGYRTLSEKEWQYLLFERTVNGATGEGKSYQRATINSDGTGVYGMIIYPDNYIEQKDAKSYTSADWTAMEAAGCVFLPAAGYRNGFSVSDVGSNGNYWSATPDDSDDAIFLNFYSNGASMYDTCRYYGCSVRLVVAEN